MDYKRFILSLVFLLLACFYPGQGDAKETKPDLQAKSANESDQQVKDFSLSGYGEKGKKSWDLAGQSADIFDEVVKLKKVVGNNYAQNDTINLTADKGDFNKNSGLVHLEDNVVITTASGTTMTTDTLDWDRKQQIVKTMDKVNLSRQDMNLSGQGASGQTALKQIKLDKDVKLDIDALDKQVNQKEKIVITCDGPLEVDYEKNIAIFNNNVKVEKLDMTIYSDKMQVYFTPKQQDQKPAAAAAAGMPAISSSINKIVALGNVRIVRGENISYSQEAIYTAADKKITLTGKPQIIIYQTENMDAVIGN
jgi:LPS export ABC transporter protein LptC